MANLLQIQNGKKAYAHKLLFEEATFAINEGEHVGVIGPNGAGKTTLFNILIDNASLDSGIYTKSKSLRLGYLAQEDTWDLDSTLEAHLEKTCVSPIWELKKLATGLGLSEEHFQAPLSKLSGGYRMRSQLLALIGCEPNLMLLDEPTNYLDLESLLILERFLQNYAGAFLLISHDREFLKRTTDHILEVESQSITKYPGNIEDYFEQKSLIREQIEKEALSVQAKRQKIMDFVNRFGAKATKAKQAQSRLKQLKKLDPIEQKPLPVTARIKIPEPIKTGKQVLELNAVSLGYQEEPVLKDVTLTLNRGEHIGIVGINGAGKSTLLKGLAGVLPPQKGNIRSGYQVKKAYFAQHVTEALHPLNSVYEELASDAHPDLVTQDIRDMAGALLFSDTDIEKKISVLSGGEKTRVALGKVLLKKSPLMLLDEPTNHLDFNTVEALTQALIKYAGTLIVISHDRAFIGRVSQKILEIRSGTVSLFPGSYDEYLWSIQKGQYQLGKEEEENQPNDPPKAKSTQVPSKNYKELRKSLKRSIRIATTNAEKIESRVNTHQSKMKEIALQLESATGETAVKLANEASEIQKSIDLDEYRWMQHLEEKETLEKELAKLTNS